MPAKIPLIESLNGRQYNNIIMISPFLQGFYAIFSGVLEALAISNEMLPWGSPAIALICLFPLYKALYRARSYRESFFLFFLQTLTVHLLSSYWLSAFHGFGVFTLGASALGTAFQGGLWGVIAYAYPFSVSQKGTLPERSGTRPLAPFLRMLWFCMLWTAYEYEKSVGALGYPWGTIFMAAYNWKIFTQISDVTGMWGVTFLYALPSALLGEVSRRFVPASIGDSLSAAQRSRLSLCVRFTLCSFALCAIYGAARLLTPKTPVKTFNAVVVQQNVDPWEAGDEESITRSMRLTDSALDSLKDAGQDADIVIWSEGVLSRAFPAAASYYSQYPEDISLSDYIASCDTPFLIGGTTVQDPVRRLFANSALLFDAGGVFSGYYSKIQLVPFAEKIPYADNPVMRFIMEDIVGFYSTLTSGFQYVIFKIPIRSRLMLPAPLSYNRPPYETLRLDRDGRVTAEEREKFYPNTADSPDSYLSFSTPICFEDAFPSVCSRLYNAGSEVFINITNDSWSATRSAELQHFIVASYLAIEYRTTLLRCANSGYTVAVDPQGKIIFDLPLFEEASAGVTVPVYEHERTVYSVFGDFFAYIATGAVLLYLLFSALKVNGVFAYLKRRLA